MVSRFVSAFGWIAEPWVRMSAAEFDGRVCGFVCCCEIDEQRGQGEQSETKAQSNERSEAVAVSRLR